MTIETTLAAYAKRLRSHAVFVGRDAAKIETHDWMDAAKAGRITEHFCTLARCEEWNNAAELAERMDESGRSFADFHKRLAYHLQSTIANGRGETDGLRRDMRAARIDVITAILAD